MLDELTNICRRQGYSYNIHYSEVENVFYLTIEDFGKIYIEIKRISKVEDLVKYALERLNENSN
jgi:hypothetical protein